MTYEPSFRFGYQGPTNCQNMKGNGSDKVWEHKTEGIGSRKASQV